MKTFQTYSRSFHVKQFAVFRVTNGTVCSTPLPSLAKYFASALFGGPLSPITDGLKKLQDLKEQQLVKTHFINLLSPRDSLSTLSPMVPDKATEKLISLPIDFWQKITSASNEINSPVYKAKRYFCLK